MGVRCVRKGLGVAGVGDVRLGLVFTRCAHLMIMRSVAWQIAAPDWSEEGSTEDTTPPSSTGITILLWTRHTTLSLSIQFRRELEPPSAVEAAEFSPSSLAADVGTVREEVGLWNPLQSVCRKSDSQ
jgi:hypothetical protein